MHHDATSNLIHAIDEYLKSKINVGVSLTIAGAQVAAPLAVDEVFDWVFAFQAIGAVYITMQIIYMLYKFTVFVKSSLKKEV